MRLKKEREHAGNIIVFWNKCYDYYDDHNPPHFHAEYNGNKALVEIDEARVIKSALPSKQLKLILAWCVLH